MKNSQRLRRIGALARATVCGVLVIGCAELALAGDDTAKPAAAAPKISAEDATMTALKAMPGKVTGVAIERKKGKQVYVVEIMTETQGEKDVLVDIVSGKVIGID